jgi:periplasmic protein TonB
VESLEDAQNKSQRSTRARSHATSFAISIAAHACAFAALIYFAPAFSKPHTDWVLAYLVEIGDGSSGGSDSIRAGAATARSIPIRSEAGPLLIPSRPTPHKTLHRSIAVRRSTHEHEADSPDSKVASLAPAASAKSAPGADSGSHSSAETETNGSSTNAGDGSGSGQGPSIGSGDGDGSSIAHADYGINPPPIYPAIARRRDQQGTVTIRALIGADGIVERAEIAESSGFDSLDDSALDTVRRRWRFVPARRDDAPVESWVLVPIRFSLTEAHASR